MLNDFSHSAYDGLLTSLQQAGYAFLTFSGYLRLRAGGQAMPKRFVLLRHDVDTRANDSVEISKIESSHNIQATYYYRAWILPQSGEAGSHIDQLLAVKEAGHEIGYHYEDLAAAGGDADVAVKNFEQHLNSLRQFADVTSICMHGSPKSKIDSKALWEHVDYHRFGLLGEPYFDLDLDDVCYLTDTGGRWDGYRFSVRDKMPERYQQAWEAKGWRYRHTADIIRAVDEGRFPPHCMLTTHPQRWSDSKIRLAGLQAVQTVKNWIKYLLIQARR